MNQIQVGQVDTTHVNNNNKAGQILTDLVTPCALNLDEWSTDRTPCKARRQILAVGRDKLKVWAEQYFTLGTLHSLPPLPSTLFLTLPSS